MIRVDDEQEQNQLECLHCVYQQQNKQYLPLELIIDSKNQTIFKGWPVLEDSQIYQNLLEATQQESLKEENIQEVKVFFKKLKAQVFNLIEQRENELLQIVEQKSNSRPKILEEYNSLSQKERLKDIILNHHQDLESQDKLLKDVVRENKKNQEIIKARLEEILDTERVFKIDMTPYKEIKDNLIEILNSFKSEIENNLNIQLISEQTNQIIQRREIPVPNTNCLEVSKIEDLPNCKNFENIIMNFKEKKIAKGEITSISNTLSDCSHIKTLELNLQDNKINNYHLQDLEKALEKHRIDKLKLDLAENNINDSGAFYISNTLDKLKNIVWLKINLGQ
ncbi:hypothetical protein ABPG74_006806, partial [Tetrahymena malaccensis]